MFDVIKLVIKLREIMGSSNIAKLHEMLFPNKERGLEIAGILNELLTFVLIVLLKFLPK